MGTQHPLYKIVLGVFSPSLPAARRILAQLRFAIASNEVSYRVHINKEIFKVGHLCEKRSFCRCQPTEQIKTVHSLLKKIFSKPTLGDLSACYQTAHFSSGFMGDPFGHL